MDRWIFRWILPPASIASGSGPDSVLLSISPDRRINSISARTEILTVFMVPIIALPRQKSSLTKMPHRSVLRCGVYDYFTTDITLRQISEVSSRIPDQILHNGQSDLSTLKLHSAAALTNSLTESLSGRRTVRSNMFYLLSFVRNQITPVPVSGCENYSRCYFPFQLSIMTKCLAAFLSFCQHYLHFYNTCPGFSGEPVRVFRRVSRQKSP